MSVQVDLLNKTERRYQGIVSMKVIVLGSIGVLVGTTVLVLSLAGISKVTLNSNLERARREWDRLSPVAATVRNRAAATEANGKVLVKAEDWSQGGRVAMHTLLRGVQSEIPEKIQLKSLFAGIQGSAKDSYFTLRLSGRAIGKLVPVEAKRKLNANPNVKGFCDDLRLVSSERVTGAIWTFAFEGRRPAGGTR